MKAAAFALVAAALALAGCASGPARPPAAPSATGLAQSPAMPSAGLGGVIGARADALVRRFGAPRLDLVEGDVRKLQFAGGTCVLNIYLYPPAAGGEPVAAHIDARQRQGGAPVPPADCVDRIAPQ